MDTATPVTEDYKKSGNACNGKIAKVTIELKEMKPTNKAGAIRRLQPTKRKQGERI